jgi:hypothetical protein
VRPRTRVGPEACSAADGLQKTVRGGQGHAHRVGAARRDGQARLRTTGQRVIPLPVSTYSVWPCVPGAHDLQCTGQGALLASVNPWEATWDEH